MEVNAGTLFMVSSISSRLYLRPLRHQNNIIKFTIKTSTCTLADQRILIQPKLFLTKQFTVHLTIYPQEDQPDQPGPLDQQDKDPSERLKTIRTLNIIYRVKKGINIAINTTMIPTNILTIRKEWIKRNKTSVVWSRA